MTRLKLGILISGGGTTFVNLHQQIVAGQLDAEICCVISSASKAKGLEHASAFGYPNTFIGRARYSDDLAYSRAITDCLKEHGADLVILAGFLKRFFPLEPYCNKTLNIHPSLIPAFCGQGYFGMAVHEAVWKRGCRVSGCTVHLVNEHYDEGPILLQKVVALADSDSPEDIRAKVFEAEKKAYPEAIRLFIENRVQIQDSRAVIRD